MKKHRVGILRVLTTTDRTLLLAHERILSVEYPDWILESRCIPEQYDGIHDRASYERALPKILDAAYAWQPELDGLIISCAGDPGVELLRARLSIPVVGAGESAASLSLCLGRKIGVLGIEDRAPESYRRILGDYLAEYIRPDGVGNTNDLQSESGRSGVLGAAEGMKERGCDLIAFACTGLSTMGAAALLAGTGLPVVDAVEAEAAVMDFKLKMKKRGSGV